MPVVGDIETMPLVELLQWVASNKKTGLLELERNKIHKQISFQQGRVVGCFDDDPSMRLGQFLISRGKITTQTLQYALRQQRSGGDRITDILISMGVLTEQEIAEQVKAKALETIYGVFEWSEAIFRFEPNSAIDRYEITVDLSIERILMEGATRQDQLQLFRGTFTSSGIVLRRTNQPIPADAEDGALVFQVLELVDGKRSLAEILARAHASDYHVLKLLFSLMKTHNIEVVEERQVDASAATLIDVRTDATPISLPSPAEFSVQPDHTAVDTQLDTDLFGDSSTPGDVLSTTPTDTETQNSQGAIAPADLHVLLEISASKMECGDSEGALVILDACYKARPHDESLRQQMARTEAACLKQLAGGPLQPDRVPQRIESAEDRGAELQPDQTTVLGMIDGKRAIQSLLWIAPLREIQVLRALHQLLDMNLIRIVEAGASQAAENPPETSPVEIPDEDLVTVVDDKMAEALEFEDGDAPSTVSIDSAGRP